MDSVDDPTRDAEGCGQFPKAITIMVSIEELIRRAAKGDRQALDALFNAAKDAEANARFQDAAYLYREAAISFRIAAFRERAQKEEAESRVRSSTACIALIENVLSSTGTIPLLQPRVKQFDREAIREVVVEDAVFANGTRDVLPLLEERLSALGVQFFSPGGSIERKLTVLLWTLFAGVTPTSEHALWQKDPLVRLLVEYTCGLLEQRLQVRRADA